jgi:acetyltransferase-like isoleucine patch superfamily enzyme
MRTLIKSVIGKFVAPVLRLTLPALDDIRRMKAYLMLSSRIAGPVDSSVVVLGSTEVRGTGRIRLGRQLLLYPDIYLETQAGGAIDLGDGVVVSRGVHIVAYVAVCIGPGSMIGEYTSIRDANHSRAADRSLRDGPHSAAAISIGSQVWIGRGVTILPGVSIGDGATVGANAVVTHDVPAGTTVAGVPAVPIRSGRFRSEAARTHSQRETSVAGRWEG